MTSAAPPTPTTRPDVRRPGPLVVEVAAPSPDRAVLTARGELTHGCADVLAEALAGLPTPVGRVEVDLAGVTFMDTAGREFLDMLAEYGRRHGTEMSATGWRGQPRRVLELVGLDAVDPLRGPVRPPAAPGAGATVPSAVARERAEQLRELREEVEQLRRAMVSRPVIDQARGILMAAHGCTSEEAWEILREASQVSNTKLRTVAAAVTAGAAAQGPPPPPHLRTALRTAIARRRGATGATGATDRTGS